MPGKTASFRNKCSANQSYKPVAPYEYEINITNLIPLIHKLCHRQQHMVLLIWLNENDLILTPKKDEMNNICNRVMGARSATFS